MNKTLHFFGLCLLLVHSVSYSQDKSTPVPKGKPFMIRPEKSSAAGRSASSLKDMIQLRKEDDLKLVKQKTDKQGFNLQKYQQYSKGIPVEYSAVSVSSRQGDIRSISGEVFDIPQELSTTPSISESAALDAALKHIGAKRYQWQTKEAILKHKKDVQSDLPKGELVYVKTYLRNPKRKKDEMALAYKFDIYAEEPLSRDFVYVDAHYGNVIHKNAIIKHASEGQAHTRYSGVQSISTTRDATLNKYVLKDDSRGQGIETYNLNNGVDYASATNFIDLNNNWSATEFDNANKDNVALDAHWGAMKTYDYFLQKHGRNSYDENGARIKSYVHYSLGFVNAFWNGEVMTYGDGNGQVTPLTALDVCAHEIAHAVCTNTADLIYMDESGALNESLSDIWGATIEHYAAPEKSTWEMGEDMNFIIRSLSNPNEHEQPDTYHGTFWYNEDRDNGGVHTNSGVMNHWYYILVTGKSGTNDHGAPYNVQGIGFDAAASIVYHVETRYLTPSSQYGDARNASIFAAIDLFGEGSNEVEQTINAWSAVGVYDATFAPTQLTSKVIRPGAVELTWKDNSSNETAFVIERSLSPDAPFERLKTVEPNTTKYTEEELPAGIYSYRVRAIIEGNSTESSNIVSFPIGTTPIIMSQTEVTACDNIFLDHGGLGNYSGGREITMVINPAEAGKKVKVNFSSFSLSAGFFYDVLLVFDGNSENAPLIDTYYQKNIPSLINATNASGALTFKFISTDETSGPGWQAHLTCEAVPAPPTLITAAASGTQIDLTWQDNSSIEQNYVVERSSSQYLQFKPITTLPANTTSYADNGLETDRYVYRLKAVTDATYSAYSGTAEASVGTPFMMSNGTYTVCNTQFLAPGGYDRYPGDNHTTMTLVPAPGSSVVINFSEFSTSLSDYLDIYDGPSTDNKIWVKALRGRMEAPQVIYPSNPEGVLTLKFESDEFGDTRNTGWRARVYCIPQPAAPDNLLANAASANQVHLTWTDHATDETGYLIERATGNHYVPVVTLPANAQSYDDIDLPTNRQYSYRIQAIKEVDGARIFSPHSNTSSATLGILPVMMKNGIAMACGNAFMDSSGDEAYGNLENYAFTLSPDAPDNKVIVDFTSFDVEYGYDTLWIYDGEDSTAPLIGAYTGNAPPPPAIATNADGKLTFKFVSDEFVTGKGWEARVYCDVPLGAPDNLVAHVAGDQVNLTWNDNALNETGYIIEKATGNLYVNVATLDPDAQFYGDTEVIDNRRYIYRVRAVRDGIPSKVSNTSSVTLGTAPILMHNGTVTACNSIFMDQGGDEPHGFGPQTLTIAPPDPGKKISVVFTQFDVGSFSSPSNYLEVFDGADTNPDNSLGKVSAANTTFQSKNMIFQATNTEGKLTFVFQTNNDLPQAGWEATVTCDTKHTPIITFEDHVIRYFDSQVSVSAFAEAYKDASFTYSLVNDGTDTGELTLGPQQGNFIGLTTVRPGTVKIKASLAETGLYHAAEKIITVTIVKRVPSILFSSIDAIFPGGSLTLAATDFYGGNVTFNYEVVNDRNNSAEVALSGPGGREVAFLKAGTVKIRVRSVEDTYYAAAERTITLNIKKDFPEISFPDQEHVMTPHTFHLDGTAYEGAEFIYSIVDDGNNTGELNVFVSRNAVTQKTGTVKVKAFVSESSGYWSAEKISTFTIVKGEQAVEFDQIPNVFNTAPPFALTASASSGLEVSYAVQSGPATVSGNMLSLTRETGTVTVEAIQAGNDNYYPATSVTRDFSVSLDPLLSTDDPLEGSFKVYPNPANDILTIESEIYEMANVSLVDVVGRTIAETNIGTMQQQLDVRSLPQGMYLLNIKTNNDRSVIKRIQIVR